MWKILLVIVICVCTKDVVGADNDTESTTEPIPDDGGYGRKCNCRCGERNEASRIVGGVETAVNAFPWVARLSYHNKFYCGGSLINDRYVLTAAHCVKTFMWFMIKVTLGEHDRCNTTHRPLTRFVIQLVANNFSFNNFKDDIALLRLNKVVPVTDSVKPVCLPRNDDKAYAGVNAIAAGWGTIAEGKNHSCYLQEVELPILSNEACKKAKYTPSMIGDGMLCAGYPDKGMKDTCQGDSGGALSAERSDKRHEQLGVVSWGIGCGRPGYPGVYTRVTKYLDWIRNIAKSGCFCCGISGGYSGRTRSGRLLGGQTVDPHEYPWLAAINIGDQVMAGSLISDRHVITAASPLYGLTPNRMSVTLGAHDRCNAAGPGLNVSVESITIHPGYSTTTLDNDIALVKLRHVVAFSQYISPICLPIFGSREYEQVTWTAGWAQTPGTCTPHIAILPTLPAASCVKGFDDNKLVSPDKGCLGPMGIKSVICKNDVGAPVMSRWSATASLRLIGVVSTSSCDVAAPPLYTRVIDHASWIYEHIRSDCQCF